MERIKVKLWLLLWIIALIALPIIVTIPLMIHFEKVEPNSNINKAARIIRYTIQSLFRRIHGDN